MERGRERGGRDRASLSSPVLSLPAVVLVEKIEKGIFSSLNPPTTTL